MATPTGPARLWTAARQLPARTPLRVKLISVLLALVAAALVAISIGGISLTRSYLLSSADAQLQQFAAPGPGYVGNYLVTGQRTFGGNEAMAWISPRGHEHWVIVPGVGYGSVGNNSSLPNPAVPTSRSWLAAHLEKPVTVSADSGSRQYRVFAYTHTFQTSEGNITGTIVAALDITNVYATIGHLVGIDLIVSLIIIVVLAIVGIALVRGSLRPLVEIERTAEGIAAGDLSRRVPDWDARTEVGRLGRSLNTMLSQVEMAFRERAASESAARGSEVRMRQFVSDASHELRTPLTAIRGFAEYYRQRGGVQNGTPDSGGLPREDLDRIMQRVEQESARMGVLVEDLLLLARLDQQRPLENRPVDLLTLAADAVHDAQVIAPGRTIQLTVEAGDAPPIVLGDEVRLRQVIGNLMSNALIHTPDGTPVEVRIRPGISGSGRAGPPGPAGLAGAPPAGMPGTVTLEVADRGRGLAPEQAGRVFERFYRADQARTRQAGGAGLGLSIVAALVAAHGGTVGVEPTPGGGATFRITMPLAPEVLAPDAPPSEVTGAELAETDADEIGPDTDEVGPGTDEVGPGLGAAEPAEHGVAGPGPMAG
jgi:two-component system OmpR family sensor kinase